MEAATYALALGYNEADHSESRSLPQAHLDSRLRRIPAGIERMAGAIDVDDHRCVIREYRFFLPRLAIDFRQTTWCLIHMSVFFGAASGLAIRQPYIDPVLKSKAEDAFTYFVSSARKSASETMALSLWRLSDRRCRSPVTIRSAWAAIAHSRIRLSGSSFKR